jgi:hypothetical protein
LGLGDIAGHRMATAAGLADLLAGPPDGRLVGSRKHDRSPGLRGTPRHFEADPGVRAADDDDLSREGFEPSAHEIPPEVPPQPGHKPGDETRLLQGLFRPALFAEAVQSQKIQRLSRSRPARRRLLRIPHRLNDSDRTDTSN